VGDVVWSGGLDRRVFARRIEGNVPLLGLKFGDSINGVHDMGNGNVLIVTAGKSDQLRIIDPRSGSEVTVLGREQGKMLSKYHRAATMGNYIVMGGCEGGIDVWDIRYGRDVVRTLDVHDKIVSRCCFVGEGKVCSVSVDGKLGFINYKC